MLYETNKIRHNHIIRIKELIDLLNNIPMKNLNGYQNVSDIISYLIDYKELIENELNKNVE